MHLDDVRGTGTAGEAVLHSVTKVRDSAVTANKHFGICYSRVLKEVNNL
jgi:hypothetical protein